MFIRKIKNYFLILIAQYRLDDYIKKGVDSSYTVKFFRSWKETLPPEGKALFLGWLICLLPGTINLHKPTLTISITLGNLLLFNYLIAKLFIPIKVKIQRELNISIKEGEKSYGKIYLENTSHRTIPDIEVFERDLPEGLSQPHNGILKTLAPYTKTILPYEIQCDKRGIYSLEKIIVSTSFPFKLYRKLRPFSKPIHLIVHPFYHPITKLDISILKIHEMGNKKSFRSSGDYPEFMGNREYQYGDNVRDLDQKAWGRSGTPITKIYEEEFFSRVFVLIDKQTHSNINSQKAFESLISLSATICDYLYKEGYSIDLVGSDFEAPIVNSHANSISLDSILNYLSAIQSTELNPPIDLKEKLINASETISTFFLLFNDWDEEKNTIVNDLAHHDTQIRVIVIRNYPTTINIPQNTSNQNIVYQQMKSKQIIEGDFLL